MRHEDEVLVGIFKTFREPLLILDEIHFLWYRPANQNLKISRQNAQSIASTESADQFSLANLSIQYKKLAEDHNHKEQATEEIIVLSLSISKRTCYLRRKLSVEMPLIAREAGIFICCSQ